MYLAVTAGQRAAGAPVDETIVGQFIDNPEAVFANDASGSDIIGLDPLASVTAAGGETYLSFTSGIDATYPAYRIVGVGLIPTNDNVSLLYQISSSSTFLTAANYKYWFGTVTPATTPGEGFSGSVSGTYGGIASGIGTDLGEGIGWFEMIWSNPASTTLFEGMKWDGVYRNYNSSTPYNLRGGGTYNGSYSDVYDGIRFYWSSGTWEAGTFYLYPYFRT